MDGRRGSQQRTGWLVLELTVGAFDRAFGQGFAGEAINSHSIGSGAHPALLDSRIFVEDEHLISGSIAS